MTMPVPVAELLWRQCLAPKRGHRPEEIEDALAGDPASGRFAVADGAAETVCSKTWADLLVQAFLEQDPPDPDRWSEWLAPVRRKWWGDVAGRQLPWFAEHKLEHGAAAAFVDLHVRPEGDFEAVAVGDCCVFQFRDQRLEFVFPCTSAEEFSNRPILVGSRGTDHEPPLLRATGRWEHGDKFLLASDAMSQWLLSRGDRTPESLLAIRALLRRHADAEQLSAELNLLREGEHLKNDDVALAAVAV